LGAFERGRGELVREKTLWELVLPALQRDAQAGARLNECVRCLEELATLPPVEKQLRESLELARAADASNHASFDRRVELFDAARDHTTRLANLLRGMGRFREATATLLDGLIMRPAELWRSLIRVNDSARQRLLDEQRCRFNLFLASASQDTRAEPAQAALETLLWRRAIGLEIHRSANRLARRSPQARELLEGLRFNRANHAAALFDAPADEVLRPRHATKIVFEPIEQSFEYQALEAQLLEHLQPLLNRFVSQPADCRELASRVPDGGLLIEYWRCTRRDARGVTASYVAVVLPKDRPDKASVIHLCEASLLEETLLDYLSLLSGRGKAADFGATEKVPPDPARARELGHTIRKLVLDPLMPWTSGAEHLLIVSDGLLGRLPFVALPLEDGYVLDRWLVSCLHTARDLFDDDDDDGAETSGSSLVFSDPAYDGPGSLANGRFRFEPLEYATLEGEAVGNLLGVTPLVGMAATKHALTTCRRPEILHIATHGMMLPAKPSVVEIGPPNPLVWRDPGEFRLQMPGLAVLTSDLGQLSDRQLPDQSLRSIVALSGVNTWLQGQGERLTKADGNGLVTAADVAGMDLAGNKVTVLSACETGLGVIGIGEGVLGLRSSFMVAGAQTVVASLWEVDDASTKDLMCAYYQNLIQRRMGRTEALQEAQKATRKRYPIDPYYWAAFVSQGAIGPIR
jgi:CHAT domain